MFVHVPSPFSHDFIPQRTATTKSLTPSPTLEHRRQLLLLGTVIFEDLALCRLQGPNLIDVHDAFWSLVAIAGVGGGDRHQGGALSSIHHHLGVGRVVHQMARVEYVLQILFLVFFDA